MNELTKQGDRRMTVREVAEVLGLDPRTIQMKVKELFPGIVEERKTTLLNEAQVTAVKMACEKKFAVKTDLEVGIAYHIVLLKDTQDFSEMVNIKMFHIICIKNTLVLYRLEKLSDINVITLYV
jgi:DNA-binding Lrp family transcriptional regulator